MRPLVPLLLTFGLLMAAAPQSAKRPERKAVGQPATRAPDRKDHEPTSSGNTRNCSGTEVAEVKPLPASEIKHVTLTEGSTHCSGWVQLILINRTVVTLGLTASSVAESDLVCQTLGCGRMLRLFPAPAAWGKPTALWDHRLDCWWNHTRLQDCMKVKEQGRQNHSLGVVCEGERAHSFPRLGPQTDHCEASLLVFHHNPRSDVVTEPTPRAADGLCQRVHCGRAVGIAPVPDRNPDVKVLGELTCLLRQNYPRQCLAAGKSSGESPVYNVTCREGFSPAFRLRDGKSQCDGLLEVYYSGSWWPVCQDTWEEEENKVVCSQVGCEKDREDKEPWSRPGSLGKNHTGSIGCLSCRQFGVLPGTGGVRLWDIQMKRGSFQQLNVTCPRSPGPTGKPQVESGSSGLVTAGILLLVLLLLLLALAWGWRRYRGDGVGVFRRKRTQRQWIGPTGATTHTVSVHRNNNASSRPVSAVSASSHNYSMEPTRGLTAYPALERRSNMLRVGPDRSSDSDYDFFEPNVQPL